MTLQMIQWKGNPTKQGEKIEIIEEREGYLNGIFHFTGFWNCKSKCGIKIEKGQKITVTFTELNHNEGTSVTNMIGDLASMIYNKFFSDIPIDNITWIEHYPERGDIEESFDIVRFEKWDGKRFSQPKWKRIRKDRSV